MNIKKLWNKLLSKFQFEAVITLEELGLQEYQELNRLLIKAGRRCAYDLAHAAAGQRRPSMSKLYHDRAIYWQGIFIPDSYGTEYRDNLHREIANLKAELKDRTAKYQALLSQHQIEDTVFPHAADYEYPF